MRRDKGGEVAKANITFFLALPKVNSLSPVTTSTAFVKNCLRVTQCVAYAWQMANIQSMFDE